MDAFLLLAAVAEIQRTLVGGLVREVVAAGPDGLWLDLATSRGPEGLLVSAEPTLPRIVRSGTRPAKTRPLPALAGSARRRLPGTRLAAIVHRGLDRVVRLDFEPALAAGLDVTQGEAGGRVVIELFGSQPNLFLTDPAGTILEAARRATAAARPCRPGLPYAPPPPPPRPDPKALGSVEAVAEAIEPWLAATRSAVSALRHGLAGVSDVWAREVAARADGEAAVALARPLVALLEDLSAKPPDPHVLTDEAGSPAGVAPVRLIHLPEARQRAHRTLVDAVDRLAIHLAARQELTAGVTDVRRVLRRLEERLRARLEKLRAEAAEFARADLYQRMGEIVVADQAAVPRGASQVALPDHAGEPGATLTIPLDPTLNASANAEQLFRSARRGRRGAMRVASRLAETEAILNRIRALSARAATIQEPSALVALRQELERSPRVPPSTGPSATISAPTPSPFSSSPRPAPKPPAARLIPEKRTVGPEPRRFVSSEGLPILVGRDNEGNDHLTLHIARSEDLWLHVEGFPGSHVVVRMQGRTGGIPRQTLVEAAKLAAYYSQARSHGKVTVSYTLKKFVRKPRKSPPGLVTVTHEKTVVVKPDKELVARLATAPTDDGS
jgi:predicted ribosome quality control (RQC) complex YloA/Tae2 family protein